MCERSFNKRCKGGSYRFNPLVVCQNSPEESGSPLKELAASRECVSLYVVCQSRLFSGDAKRRRRQRYCQSSRVRKWYSSLKEARRRHMMILNKIVNHELSRRRAARIRACVRVHLCTVRREANLVSLDRPEKAIVTMNILTYFVIPKTLPSNSVILEYVRIVFFVVGITYDTYERPLSSKSFGR